MREESLIAGDLDSWNHLEGLVKTLGIHFENIAPDGVRATMPVTERLLQPMGFLHGGATLAFSETAASAGGVVTCPIEHMAIGLETHGNHLRPVQGGILTANATPLHLGKRTQVWDVKILDEEGRLVHVAHCTLAIVAMPDGPLKSLTPID